MDRGSVNMLRHEATPYDVQLSDATAAVGVDEARRLVRGRTLAVSAAVWAESTSEVALGPSASARCPPTLDRPRL